MVRCCLLLSTGRCAVVAETRHHRGVVLVVRSLRWSGGAELSTCGASYAAHTRAVLQTTSYVGLIGAERRLTDVQRPLRYLSLGGAGAQHLTDVQRSLKISGFGGAVLPIAFSWAVRCYR